MVCVCVRVCEHTADLTATTRQKKKVNIVGIFSDPPVAVNTHNKLHNKYAGLSKTGSGC